MGFVASANVTNDLAELLSAGAFSELCSRPRRLFYETAEHEGGATDPQQRSWTGDGAQHGASSAATPSRLETHLAFEHPAGTYSMSLVGSTWSYLVDKPLSRILFTAVANFCNCPADGMPFLVSLSLNFRKSHSSCGPWGN